MIPWKKRGQPAAVEDEQRRQRELICATALELILAAILPVQIIEKGLGAFAAKGQSPSLADLVVMRRACNDYISEIEAAAETARTLFAKAGN